MGGERLGQREGSEGLGVGVCVCVIWCIKNAFIIMIIIHLV